MAVFDGARVIYAAGGAVAAIANFSRRHAPAMWPPVADFRVSQVIFLARRHCRYCRLFDLACPSIISAAIAR